jgi:citrate lyase subunit beta / citryl-CoA lyase
VIDWTTQVLRALLFAPGSEPRKLAKVGSFGADAIVLDLEDAVAEEEKSTARTLVRDALATYSPHTPTLVRVNGPNTGRLVDDVRSVVCGELDGILLPKVEDCESLAVVDGILAEEERARGLEVGGIRLLALIETARGVASCDEILGSAPARLVTAVFGLGDFSTDIGVDLTPEGTELLYARSRIVVAARAAGLARPVDGPYFDLADTDGLLADSIRSRRLGFQGRVTVYPPQVEPTQRAYSWLPDDEVERARTVVDAFEQAEREGLASISVDGQFIDYPVYERAREKLRRHRAHQESG